MRPVRKKIKFTEDSVNDLLQEIYNDTHVIRAKITRLFTKWETKINDAGEVAAIGDQIIKLIAEEGKTQDKKISLLKILREIVFANKKAAEITSKKDNDEVTDERRSELYDIIEQTINNRG